MRHDLILFLGKMPVKFIVHAECRPHIVMLPAGVRIDEGSKLVRKHLLPFPHPLMPDPVALMPIDQMTAPTVSIRCIKHNDIRGKIPDFFRRSLRIRVSECDQDSVRILFSGNLCDGIDPIQETVCCGPQFPALGTLAVIISSIAGKEIKIFCFRVGFHHFGKPGRSKPDQLLLAPSIMKVEKQVHPCVFSRNRKSRIPVFKSRKQRIMSAFIQRSHFIQMSLVITVFDKFLQNKLIHL